MRLYRVALPAIFLVLAGVFRPLPARGAEAEKQRFQKALRFVLRWEGGFVDDPDDPGGRTNKGITQTTYNRYRKDKKLPRKDVKFISDAEVEDIYFTRYWRAAHCPELPDRLGLVQMDTAVNMGVGTATRFLQQALGVKPDAIFGPRTRDALRRSKEGEVIRKYLNLRVARYRKLAQGRQKKFLKGWLNRVNDLRRVVGVSGSK